MFHPLLPIVLALLISSSVAHGSPDAAPSAQVATQIPARVSHTVIEGIFVRYHESPDRDIDGIVLEDGMTARFAPIKRITRSASLRPGDSVRIEGDVVIDLAGPYLTHAVVTTGNLPVARGEIARPSPAGSANRNALSPRAARPGKASVKETSPSPRGRLKTIAAKIRKTTTGEPKGGIDSRWSRTRETSGP